MQPMFVMGDLVLDVVARLDRAPDPDTDTPAEVVSAPGGSAANFAVWTARLGDATCFTGRVGNDLLGRALVDDLAQEGVRPFVALDPDRSTAVLVLFAEGTQRHMFVPAGANHHLDASDVPTEALRGAGWLHLTGYSYFWEPTARAAARALAVAADAGVPVSLDLASAGFIRRRGLTLPCRLQVLMANAEEAMALTGSPDAHSAALWLNEAAPLVAVKLGPDGALICQDGRLTHIPAAEPGGPVVDTTGAGDAWGAAFVSGLRHGQPAVAAADWANRLAAQVITKLGARPAIHLPWPPDFGISHEGERTT